jgi:DNA primase
MRTTLACVAGRINEDDIATVRERARIDEVVAAYVNLRNAGGGSLQGLCPFHDEKTPSFRVTPARGFWYCFGACGEGGDVISFLQKIDNLSFSEAVERLADRVGIHLRYTDDDGGRRPEPGRRMRLLEAHAAAAEFYAEQLMRPEALEGRQFLGRRGFDRAAAEHFGIGFAPRDGRALLRHLRGRGFSDAELVAAGLAKESGWDFFQSRLLWPIRDSGRQVVGFGARRIFEDDRLPAKYVNTPETLLYKKSHVLYGLDLARQAIGRKSQAVVVEGYTDVMAAHLSGVDTAVAACGTAFGEDHARMLTRLMGNHDAFRGEVIFTFDGDEAGQAAALKVYGLDATFTAQTYVAVEPSGLDPCDLRIQHGEAAVRELVARRVPLYRYVMSNVLQRHDLDRADGRLAALREAAPLIASIRDRSMIRGYALELAGRLGMDEEEVRREVIRVTGSGKAKANLARTAEAAGSGPNEEELAKATSARRLPDPRDRTLATERETAKLLVQAPHLFGPDWNGLAAADFTHPAYAAVFTAVEKAVAAGDPVEDTHSWVHRLSAVADDEQIASLLAALAVEPLPVAGAPTVRFAAAYAAGLQLLTVMRAIAELKSRLQRTSPVEQTRAYNQMFSELVQLERRRKDLQQLSLGNRE